MKCPGQDTRYWGAEAIFETACPGCGAAMEFFKDDPARSCRNCGRRVANPRLDFGCAAHCPYAEQCLGGLPPELQAAKTARLRDRIAAEMKKRLGGDFQRIGRAVRAARHAERIGAAEGADTAVVLAGVCLREMEAQAAEGSVWPFPRLLVAPELLSELGAGRELSDEVNALLTGRPSPGGSGDLNLRVLHDAGILAEMESKSRTSGHHGEGGRPLPTLLTRTGREIGESLKERDDVS